jgi:hypothetical protein
MRASRNFNHVGEAVMIKRERRVLLSLALVATAILGSASPASAITSGLNVAAQGAFVQEDRAAVVLIGWYTCGPFANGVPDRGVVDLTIRQTARDVETTAFGFLTPTVCDGRGQRFAIDITAVDGTFKRGPARWSASGYVEGSTGIQTVFVPPTRINIR